MASSSAVVLEPEHKGCGAVGVGCEDLSIDPLGLQGSIEPFNLAVLPGAVRADEYVPGPQR